MADLILAESPPLSAAKNQIRAVAWLRWRTQVNALRSQSGKFEFGARVFSTAAWLIAGLVAAIGLAAGSYALVERGRPEGIAVMLWGLLLYWQLLPIATSSTASGLDSQSLLRFPLSYPAYFFLRVLYGSLDITTGLALLCLVGIWTGVSIASPPLLSVAFVMLLVFALLNILLSRAVFAWIDRWLAKRRTRELMSVLLLLLALAPQIIGRTARQFRLTPEIAHRASALLPYERLLPPGVAASGIAHAARSQLTATVFALALLCLYAAVCGLALHVRMRAQYRGEDLSEAPRHAASSPSARITGISVPGLVPSALAALIDKEVRYFARSGPFLLSLITPLLLLFFFGSSRNSEWHRPVYLLFPIGAAYTLLTLPQLVYNSFGAEGAGIQFYFSAPVRIRTILLAKNLVHGAIYSLQLAILWFAIAVVYRRPAANIFAATLAWALFALPINLAVGDLVSLWAPKRIEFAKFGRSRVSGLSSLIGFGVLLATIGTGALVFTLFWSHGLFLVTALFLLLATCTFAGYTLLLKLVDAFAIAQREKLTSELCRQ